MSDRIKLPGDYDSLCGFCESVFGLYVFAAEVEIKTGEMSAVAGDPEICRAIDRLKNCEELIRYLNEYYIHERSRALAEVFFDLESVKGRLRERDFLSMEFLGVDRKWYLVSIVPKREGEGELEKVYLLMRKSERRRSEELAVFSSAAHTYDGLYFCNAANDTYHTYKRSQRGIDEEAPETGSYDLLIRRTGEKIVSEREREYFIDFASADRVCENLRDRSSLDIVYKIGEERFRLSFTAAEYDRFGSVMKFTAAVKDVTAELGEEERKSAELNSRLEAILSGITGGFRICRDEEGFPYEYASEGVAALQGYTVDEFLRVSGGMLLGSVYPDDAESAFTDIDRQYEQGDTYSVRYRVIHRDGSLRWVSDSGKRVTTKDGRVLHYSLIQDITASKRSIDALHGLFAMQRQMVEAIGSGLICYTFPEKELILLNDEACRIIECGVGEDPIEALFDFLSHRVISENRMMSNGAIQPENPGDFRLCEYRVRSAKGEIWKVKYSARLIRLDDGQLITVVNLTDLTEQARLASMLSRERVQYRDALTTNCEYTLCLDLTEGVVSADSEQWGIERFTGELGIGLPYRYDKMMELWKTKWQPQLLTPHAEELLSCRGLSAHYERGNTILEMECFIPPQERYYRWIVLLSTDETSGHEMAVVVVYDFTELHREAERKRIELEDLYRSQQEKLAIIEALGNIYYSIYYVDLASGMFSLVSGVDYFAKYSLDNNDAARTAKKWTERGLNEENRKELLDFFDLTTLSDRMKHVASISRECVSKSSGWIRVNFIVANRDSAGDVTRVLWTVQHIDREKQRELEAKNALQEAYDAANRANTAKTDFLATMSHEIRTPLNAVIGMTAIAGTHLNEPERIADCLSKINSSGHRLLGLINELLDMNKIESGRLDLNIEECNLSELIEQIVETIRPQLEAKRHEFKLNFGGITHENVIGDGQRLAQMLTNLLGNAIKFTPAGGRIALTISEKVSRREKVGCYEFMIEDNGIGMSEDYLPRLFEPFTRANDPRVEKIGGVGLGMAISRNIARMMNGDIQAVSRLNEGTRVTATIFLELRGHDDGFRSEMLAGLPVLIADDDRIVCESACLILRELGMIGEWVESGEQAIERVLAREKEGKDYFAILLDWKMAGADGVSVAKGIRRCVGKDVPIVIISSYDWSEIEEEASEAGVDAFLNKPLFKSRMAHLFKELLERKAKPEALPLDRLVRESFSGARALLVEDNELNAEIAKEIFGMLGLEVEHAPNGKAALDRMKAAKPGEFDIIFMDIQMPIMNGYEATRAIRALPGEYPKNVPIFAMSANAFAEDVHSAKEAGMNEHIAKPLDFARLQKLLNAWLK
ncbi:MAG: response regulator [Bacteroides sp.]|nr:response regulator [Eubacterium sp.]MCM1417475.1 response regulator [Roseburia sp.]MCM1461655.1 response regulator [Bacteroides sp.]